MPLPFSRKEKKTLLAVINIVNSNPTKKKMAMADIIIKKKILFAGFHSDGYDDDVDGDECKITAISLFT